MQSYTLNFKTTVTHAVILYYTITLCIKRIVKKISTFFSSMMSGKCKKYRLARDTAVKKDDETRRNKSCQFVFIEIKCSGGIRWSWRSSNKIVQITLRSNVPGDPKCMVLPRSLECQACTLHGETWKNER